MGDPLFLAARTIARDGQPHQAGSALAKLVKVDEKQSSGTFSLGKFALPKGGTLIITLGNGGTDGFVVADGVQLLLAK